MGAGEVCHPDIVVAIDSDPSRHEDAPRPVKVCRSPFAMITVAEAPSIGDSATASSSESMVSFCPVPQGGTNSARVRRPRCFPFESRCHAHRLVDRFARYDIVQIDAAVRVERNNRGVVVAGNPDTMVRGNCHPERPDEQWIAVAIDRRVVGCAVDTRHPAVSLQCRCRSWRSRYHRSNPTLFLAVSGCWHHRSATHRTAESAAAWMAKSVDRSYRTAKHCFPG